ncbi:MAG: transglutaminase family protein [Cereibacter sphaeroides]|uniref:Transglutaminase family protein n=1 Tax=Cereibacter sphaeroides TaxID=1063 RepID=A0A2W5S437_CERSP|nr:MAG: transglutaminase family protein [Cereibacter sphaeroides]
MILTVDHVTVYRYAQPVRGVVQSHRMTPSVFEGQKVRDWQVTVSDGIKGGGFRDGAGDWVQSWSVLGPVSDITVTVRGIVETFDLTGLLRGHKETIPREAYMNETAPTRADAALAELAEAAKPARDVLDAAHSLSAAVAAAIEYTPGVTQAQTTAAEALSLGKGVCQDHAHALISVARRAGMPARYVSGYLMSGEPGQAAHAWAEIWVQGLGWVGFDPANECCPDDRYIRLGSGVDAQDAAPIKGSARGIGAEILDVSVAVQAVQQ